MHLISEFHDSSSFAILNRSPSKEPAAAGSNKSMLSPLLGLNGEWSRNSLAVVTSSRIGGIAEEIVGHHFRGILREKAPKKQANQHWYDDKSLFHDQNEWL